MELTDREVGLLRESYNALRPELEDASVAFYQRLFELAPEIRPMFRDDVENQGMRFMSAVGTILAQLDQPGGGVELLDRLGQGHAAMGVRPQHFQPMRTALIDTFQLVLGTAFTVDQARAWRKAFDQITEAMNRAGEAATSAAHD